MWTKLKFFSRVHLQMCRGESKEKMVNLNSNPNVNEEYQEAFRTRSYTEIWRKAQGELRRTNQEQFSLSYTHLSQLLLEPCQETVINEEERVVIGLDCNSDLHQHIYDFFNTSAEACNICGVLLQSIAKTRLNYKIVQRIINLKQTNGFDYTMEQCKFIFGELYLFTQMENPLSDVGPERFKRIHDLYGSMLKGLKLRRKKIMSKIKLIRFYKRASGVGLVLAFTAVMVVGVIILSHGSIGVLAGPLVVNACWGLLKHRFKMFKPFKTSVLRRVDAQLEAAAKGDYILYRDFDTMSRLVTRLHDEIEHMKGIISVCLVNKERELLREVVKQFEINELTFLEQIEELEEHVYLCFLTINRVRRLVLEEISNQQLPS